MIKCIIFDFDGVIAESNDVKAQGFREIFAEYPEHQDTIADFHRRNGGLSRFIKVRYFFEELLKEPLDEARLNQYCEKYSSVVKQKVIDAEYVPGAVELLDRCEDQYDMYVVSGTPEDEMREIIQKKGLAKYFKDVYGSPRGKTEIINEILEKQNCAVDEVVFIGDSLNDLIAAKDTGVYFIGRTSSEESGDWQNDEDIYKNVADLTIVHNLIEQLNVYESVNKE